MPYENLIAGSGHALPLWLVSESSLPEWLASQPAGTGAWVRAHRFTAERHRVLTLPAAGGSLAGAVAGCGPLASLDALSLWDTAHLAERLPPEDWRIATALAPGAATQLVLGWLQGGYRIGRFRQAPPPPRARLQPPAGADLAYALASAEALAQARELIDAPANLLGPAELAEAAVAVANRTGGRAVVTRGEDLRTGFPLVHTVGAASSREPCLIDLRWPGDGPRVTLVGKGVCFDSGGLDMKSSSGMLLMKKDMGGAACALALAELLVRMRAPVALRVLIPAVENSVGSRAFRPGDVLRSRKGLAVEVGNTDAEGRLILADALCAADEEKPALLIDLATLTGAARVALGPELPAVFSPDPALGSALSGLGMRECDPVWSLPLWSGYEDELGSKLADVNNVSASAFAGAIFGGLFLRRFVAPDTPWLHLDLYAWNPRERPGRPVGAEPQCVRALYRLIRERCG